MTHLLEVAARFEVAAAEDSSDAVPFNVRYTLETGQMPLTRVLARPVVSEDEVLGGLLRHGMARLVDLMDGGPAALRYEIDYVTLAYGMYAVFEAADDFARRPPTSSGGVAYVGWLRAALAVLLEVEAAGGPLPAAWPPAVLSLGTWTLAALGNGADDGNGAIVAAGLDDLMR
ncbi:hypothetical protein FF36_06321 [Frankia torreyi]|uniref:Uncharacterized protein n=2 Tax=Frankia TaxID=1854 RepID=A0A0D8B5L7_9ACTN|nr:hypothetical protein [Frankia torreyi]AAB88414.1 transmembrane protein [Frankia sp.]KJE19395.1 hypothetical protein FF36_06321 [Frankia torreyi]